MPTNVISADFQTMIAGVIPYVDTFFLYAIAVFGCWFICVAVMRGIKGGGGIMEITITNVYEAIQTVGYLVGWELRVTIWLLAGLGVLIFTSVYMRAK